jgi:mRNA-degrading endonuclease RelE of RelBE toxin-antitoxin system
MAYRVGFEEGWDENYSRMDNQVRLRIANKLLELKEERTFRRLRNLSYSIIEIGQYRVAFEEDSANKIRTVIFIGDHKEYERWYSQLF